MIGDVLRRTGGIDRLLVAVGDDGVALTSEDGVFWDVESTPVSTALNDVIWAADLGIFIAVGSSGVVLTSFDGRSWTQRTTPNTGNIRGVAWAPSLELAVAVTMSGNHSMTSPDGVTWTSMSGLPSGLPTNVPLTSVDWSESQGVFVVVASQGFDYFTSTDGFAWTSRSGLSESQSVDWFADPERWIVCRTSNIAWASNIVAFTNVTLSPTNQTPQDATYSPELGLFAVATSTGRIYTSPTGEGSWTERANLPNFRASIEWSSQAGLFIVGSSASDPHQTSPDGINWTERSLPGGVGTMWGIA